MPSFLVKADQRVTSLVTKARAAALHQHVGGGGPLAEDALALLALQVAGKAALGSGAGVEHVAGRRAVGPAPRRAGGALPRHRGKPQPRVGAASFSGGGDGTFAFLLIDRSGSKVCLLPLRPASLD